MVEKLAEQQRLELRHDKTAAKYECVADASGRGAYASAYRPNLLISPSGLEKIEYIARQQTSGSSFPFCNSLQACCPLQLTCRGTGAQAQPQEEQRWERHLRQLCRVMKIT